MQQLGVYSQEFQSPRFFAGVDLSAAGLCEKWYCYANTSIRIRPEEHRVLLVVRPIVFSNGFSAFGLSGHCLDAGTPVYAEMTGQPSANGLVEVLQSNQSHKDHKWNKQENPYQLRIYARMPCPRVACKNIYERNVSDIEGIGKPAAELAEPYHACACIRVRSTKDDEREQEEHACCVIKTVERETTHFRELWHLKAQHKNNRKQEQPNPGKPNAVMNSIKPETHHERDREA